MKAFSLILVLLSSSLWAQDNFQKKMSELEERREEAKFQWRTQNKFNESTLAPFSKLSSYKEFIEKLETDHLASEIKLHDEACAETKTHCLTPQEKEKKRLEVMSKLADLAKRTSTQMENVPQVAARPLVTPENRREVSSEVRPERPERPPGGQRPEMRPDFKPGEGRPPERPESRPEMRPSTLPKPEVASTVRLETKTVETKKTETTVSEVKPTEVVEAKPVTTPEVKAEVAEVKSEVRPEVTPETKPVVTPEVKPEVKPEEKPVVPTENEDEQSPKNYKAETCKWVNDLPRRIHVGPGCGGKSRSRMCTGYVVCEQKVGGGKFIRQSTCAADKCGEGDAVACTKDQYFFSTKPSDMEKQFVSPKLKEILSSEQ